MKHEPLRPFRHRLSQTPRRRIFFENGATFPDWSELGNQDFSGGCPQAARGPAGILLQKSPGLVRYTPETKARFVSAISPLSLSRGAYSSEWYQPVADSISGNS